MVDEDARVAVPDAEPEGYVDVVCGPMTPVSPVPPVDALIEPALLTDGLTLLARFSFQDHIAVRASPGEDFGEWSRTTDYLALAQDHSFLTVAGEEIGVGAEIPAGGEDRQLTLCSAPFATGPCDVIRLFDSSGALITDDVDGPSLALRDGELVVAFNRGSEVFFARPRSAGSLDWDATRIDIGTGLYGDPALSEDGRILAVSDTARGNSIQLAVWDASADNFVPVQELSTIIGGSPEIGLETAAGWELFLVTDTRGVVEPHRVSCL